MASQTEKFQDNTIELAARVQAAMAFLDQSAERIKRDWVEIMDAMNPTLESIRLSRVAFEHETRLVLSQCRDVRKFFIEDEHAAEIARLKEFVSLCERMRALQQDGTLDVMAEIILKLASSCPKV